MLISGKNIYIITLFLVNLQSRKHVFPNNGKEKDHIHHKPDFRHGKQRLHAIAHRKIYRQGGF